MDMESDHFDSGPVNRNCLRWRPNTTVELKKKRAGLFNRSSDKCIDTLNAIRYLFFKRNVYKEK